MNVLLLGSGGREHAFAWKMCKSTLIDNLYVAPGNAGTAAIATNINMAVTDFKGIKSFVIDNKINLVVVGPEEPLVKGIVDFFENDNQIKHIPVIGPNKQGAQLEGSKDFAKAFMQRHNIPTAKYATFTKEQIKHAEAFLDNMKAPYVIKADGLAAGKGVIIAHELKEAKRELKAMLSDEKFGDASKKVVIEEYLKGIELSVFVLTDGKSYKILPAAKDYKRVGEGDTGLNTGGMGAVSPVPFAGIDFMDKVENRIIIPTIKGLQTEGIKYKGFIFIGLMNVKGEPYVIEYNCRMGDPETEAVIPRIKSDILDLFEGVATETLSERDIEVDNRTAVTIMLVSKGYPGNYEKGKEIVNLNAVLDGIAFHAGTAELNGKIVTNGGRVLAVTSLGKDIECAREKSLYNADAVDFEGKYFRKDIGIDLLKIPQQA
jgi:phosphoribosylamine--glycine ligase